MANERRPLPDDPSLLLAAVTRPLLELFAVCDDVCTEADMFENEQTMRASLGRILRQWKKTRMVLDPDFDPKDYQHPRTTTRMRKAKLRRRT